MISGIKIVTSRWNYQYPKKDSDKVQPIQNEKKFNNQYGSTSLSADYII